MAGVKGRNLGGGLAVLLLLTLVVVLLAFSYKFQKRIDITEGQRHTLSTQTLAVLKGLDEEVRIAGFFNVSQKREIKTFEDLLDQYRYHSSRLVFRTVDPDKKPAEAKKAGVKGYGTVVLLQGERREEVKKIDEENLTNALIKVTRKNKKRIYFLKGHGERETTSRDVDGYGYARTALEDSGFQVSELFFTGGEEIPEDIALLVIAGPEKALLQEEISRVGRYLDQGGKLLVMVDPGRSSDLGPFLEKYRVVLKDDVVLDNRSRVYGVDATLPVSNFYGDHPIVKGFTASTFFPLARSVSVTPMVLPGIGVTPLLHTSKHSWAEKWENPRGKKFYFDEEFDQKGPIILGVVVTVGDRRPNPHGQGGVPPRKKKKEGKLVVLGDSDFASNSRFKVLGNSDFFLNTVSWLAEEEELISLRPKGAAERPFTLKGDQVRTAFWIVLVFMPSSVVLVGIMVYRKRRSLR